MAGLTKARKLMLIIGISFTFFLAEIAGACFAASPKVDVLRADACRSRLLHTLACACRGRLPLRTSFLRVH